MSLRDLSKEALAQRLVSLYDMAAGINDRLRRHPDHVTYEGGMNQVEDLQQELHEVQALILEHDLRPDIVDEDGEVLVS